MFSSDVESLKQGIIKTPKDNRQADNHQADYTILLVGETGSGKSTFVEFLINVIIGNNIDRYDFGILDASNEQSGSSDRSHTNSARLYQITSKNGIVVS